MTISLRYPLSMEGRRAGITGRVRMSVIRTAIVCAGLLSLPYGSQAETITFSKSKYQSVTQAVEAQVNLSVTDAAILIEGRKPVKKAPLIKVQIPFSSIETMSYEIDSRHRIAEGTAVMGASLGAGAILMATKTKSYWLAIHYTESGNKQTVMLQLDKSEYKQALSVIQERTGKHIETLDPKAKSLNPTAGSKDVDQVVPYGMDKVAAAVKTAMESEGCNITEQKQDRIECKRARGYSEQTGGGGEKVTARFETEGDGTRVRISTGKGAAGRVWKKNWSTPIYQQTLANLQGKERSGSAEVKP